MDADPSKLYFECATTVDVIERVFSVEFPFNKFEWISWYSEDFAAVEKIPKNVFRDKSFKEIYLDIPIASIHPEAFESSKSRLKDRPK